MRSVVAFVKRKPFFSMLVGLSLYIVILFALGRVLPDSLYLALLLLMFVGTLVFAWRTDK